MMKSYKAITGSGAALHTRVERRMSTLWSKPSCTDSKSGDFLSMRVYVTFRRFFSPATSAPADEIKWIGWLEEGWITSTASDLQQLELAWIDHKVERTYSRWTSTFMSNLAKAKERENCFKETSPKGLSAPLLLDFDKTARSSSTSKLNSRLCWRNLD